MAFNTIHTCRVQFANNYKIFTVINILLKTFKIRTSYWTALSIKYLQFYLSKSESKRLWSNFNICFDTMLISVSIKLYKI